MVRVMLPFELSSLTGFPASGFASRALMLPFDVVASNRPRTLSARIAPLDVWAITLPSCSVTSTVALDVSTSAGPFRRNPFASPLWSNHAFVRVWAAASVSIFGSLITRVALPLVAILTLGATRPWLLRPRSNRHSTDDTRYKGTTHDLRPSNGDLLVMGGRCQADWEHSVPPIREHVEPRVSVQWRWTSKRGRPEVGANYRAPLHYSKR